MGEDDCVLSCYFKGYQWSQHNEYLYGKGKPWAKIELKVMDIWPWARG